MTIPKSNIFNVEHSFLEICVQSSNQTNFRFFIERVSRENIPDLWGSKINVVYLGKADSCNLNSTTWLINEVP